MPGLSKVIVLDADVRASRQVQLGFERESVPTVVIAADEAHALPAEDAGLVVIGGADGQALELVRQTRAWRDARHLDAPILFASRGVRRTDAEAAGADEVVLQPAFLRDIVTLGRMLRGLRAEQRTRLVGSLVDVAGVFPLVRALAGLGRSATLTLIRGLRRGEIRFYHGEVTSAQVGMIHGQAALHQLLLWTDARFDFHHEEVVRRQQIPLSHDELFADAERFLESVRDASGGLSPAIVLEQDVERLQTLGKQIPTQVYGVLRLFDGYRVLADALEDSPYRVFETLRVAQRAVEAGLLRVVDKEPPRPTWRAILGIEEWLVGGGPPAAALAHAAATDAAATDAAATDAAPTDADATEADADSEPVATQPAARITERGPSMDSRKTARKPRRKKKRRAATPPVARAASPITAAPVVPAAPAAPAAIDWGALVPRVVGAEVGSLAGVVPAAHVSGEITASASRASTAATGPQPTVVLGDATDDPRETPNLSPASSPDALAHLAPPSGIGPAVLPHDIAHFAPPSGIGPAVPHDEIAHYAPPSGIGPAVPPHDIAHFAPPSGLGPVAEADDLELAPIPRVRRGPGAFDRSRRETEADERAGAIDPDGGSHIDEAAWAAQALVRATAEALARAEATLRERRAAQRLAIEVAAVATTDAEAKTDAAARARADAATRAEQAALAQAAAQERREAERVAVEAAARAEADARASAEAAATAEADARAKAEAAAQATSVARASAEAAAQADAEARAKAEASEQADADARAKVEAAAQATAIARASADAAAQAEADARAMASAAARADAEALARAEAATHTEGVARAMADAAARAQAAARARSEEAARADADARAKSEAAARADADAEAKAAAAAQADTDARVIAELAAAAEAIAREQREAEHLAAEAAARADNEMRALRDAMARAEADARAMTEALAMAAADAFGEGMDRTHTDVGAPALPDDAGTPSEHRPAAPTTVVDDLRLADTKPERTTPRPRSNRQATGPATGSSATSEGASTSPSTVPTEPMSVPADPLIAAVYDAEIETDEDEPVTSPGFRAARSTIRGVAVPRVGGRDADERDLDERDTKPFTAQARPTDERGTQPLPAHDPAPRDAHASPTDERDTKPRPAHDASPRDANASPTDERDTKPLPAQTSGADHPRAQRTRAAVHRDTQPELEVPDAAGAAEREVGSPRATERGVAAPRPPEGGGVAVRITQPGFAAAPGSTGGADESPFDGNTPVDSRPSAILDEPSDGIVRQHITTADTAPVKRRRLPSDPPEDDRPGAAMGEITASTRAATEPRYSEPSILVADLFADSPAVPDAVTDTASNQATAPIAHVPAGDRPAGEGRAGNAPVGSGPTGHAPIGDASPPLAQASATDPHAPASTQPAANTERRPQTQRSARAAQEPGPRREKRTSEQRREALALDEVEEAFFRAGHEKEAPAGAPRPESFDDLDEGYRPVGFWDRLRGRSARRRRKSTGPVNTADAAKPDKPLKR